MTRRNLLAIAGLILAAPAAAFAQKAPNFPRLRAALHELREARGELKVASDSWPAGYKDRALASIDDAINSVRGILKVNDVNSFRGVDRNEEYYKRFKDHPRLRCALQDLREARGELLGSPAEVGDLKGRAIDDIDVAIGDILVLIRNDRR